MNLPTIVSLPLCPVFKGAKEGARKRHPDCPGPSGYLPLLVIGGTLKNSLRSDSFNVFFRQQLRCSAGQMGL
jgi:hypothetical protein